MTTTLCPPQSEGTWITEDSLEESPDLIFFETNLEELARRKGVDPTGYTAVALGALLYAEEAAMPELRVVAPPPTPIDVPPRPELDVEAYKEALKDAGIVKRRGAGDTDSATPDQDDDGGRFGVADVVDYVTERYELGRASDGKLIAVPLEGPQIARNLSGLKQGVAASIFTDLRRTPSPTTIATAWGILEGLAAEAEPIPVYLRAAYDYAEKAVYVDLGDADKTIVRVDPDGWTLNPSTSPVFRRTSATRALPKPQRTEHGREDLARLLGLEAEGEEFRLVWGWLVAAFFSDIPRPLLWATGEQGSGKTTRAKMILNLVDPADELGGNIGKNERDDSTGAAGRFVATYDNLRHISEATSDWICRLVTGVTIDRRALYSDDGMHTSVLQRTGLATSINLPYGLGPDAVERLITMTFPRVPESERKTEREIELEYENLRPGLFGALLADVAGVLANLDLVDAERLPRMADYAVTLHALDLATGGNYAEAYTTRAARALEERAEEDPFLVAVADIARDARDGTWTGTASDLAEEVVLRVDVDVRTPSSRGMWGALQNAATALRAVGVTAERRKSNGAKVIVLTYAEPGAGEADD